MMTGPQDGEATGADIHPADSVAPGAPLPPPSPSGLPPSLALPAEPPTAPQLQAAFVGWQAGLDAPAPAGRGQAVLAPLAILGASLLVSLASDYRVAGPPTDAYTAGHLVGSVLAPLLVAGIALLIGRAVMDRRRPARYRLAATTAALLLTVVSSAGAIGATVRPAADPAGAMVIAPPYSLAAATVDVEQYFAGAARDSGTKAAVKTVLGPDGANVGVLVATTGGSNTPQFWAEFDQGFTNSSKGGTTTPTTFHGKEARLFHAGSLSGITWVTDDGLIMAVYASSDGTASAVAEAQVQAATSK